MAKNDIGLKKKIKTLVIITLATIALSTPIVSAQVPSLPAFFHGSLTINGVDAPIDTVITAKIDDEVRGTLTMNTTWHKENSGMYGGAGPFEPRLEVIGDRIADYNKTIKFYVQTPSMVSPVLADQTSIWVDGKVEQLNLTVTLPSPPPKPPTNVRAFDTPNDGGGSITITWTKSADDGAGENDVIGYEILRTTTSGINYTSIGKVSAGVEIFIDNTTIDGIPYFYIVNVSDRTNSTSSLEVGPVYSSENLPPASITNLKVFAKGLTWINWTWDNPIDPDFSHTMVYLNGIFKTNTSNAYYNATGLSAGKNYTLSTRTVDTGGNINSTWVNSSATTSADLTPPSVINPTATPPDVDANGIDTTDLRVTVFDESAIASVTVDLSSVGGSATQAMNDLGNGVYSYSLTVPSSVSAGSKTLRINATDLYGNSNNTEYFSITVRDVTPPSVTNPTADPPTIKADGITTSTLSVTVRDPGSGVASVTIDLSAIGESPTKTMSYIGNDVYTATTTASVIGTFNLPVKATDNAGNTNTSVSITLTAVETNPPLVTNPSATPSSIPADGITTTTLNVTVIDLESGVASVTIDLSAIGRSATQVMNRVGTTNVYTTTTTASVIGTFNLPVKATDNAGNTNTSVSIPLNVTTESVPPVVTNPSATPSSIPADGITTSTLSVTVVDIGTGVESVTVDLSAIGGSPTKAMNPIGNNVYTTTTTSTVEGTFELPVNATDKAGNSNTSVSISLTATEANPPLVTNPSANPPSIPADGVTTTRLNVTVIDDTGVESVTVDLSAIGGSPSQKMNKIGLTEVYTTTTTAHVVGSFYLQVNAIDVYGNSNTSVSIPLSVTTETDKPIVTNPSATPSSIPADGITTSTLSVTVRDIGTGVESVTIDLSAIGGSPTQAMNPIGNDVYTTTTTASVIGTFELPVNATDKAGNSNTSVSITLTATEINPPIVTNPSATPSSIPADGITTTTLNVTVIDLESGVASVTVDLSAIGGSPIQKMNRIGLTEVYTTTTTASVVGNFSLPVNATDKAGNSNTSVSIALTTTAPVNITREIKLAQGWNLISLPVVPANTSIDSIMSSVNYSVIWTTTSTGTWKSNNQRFGAITNMTPDRSYMVYMETADTLVVTGTVPKSTTIQFAQGWNLVGYPSLTAKNITEVLPAGIDVVWTTTSIGTWKSNNQRFSPITQMSPGGGYMIYASTGGNYTITN